MLTKEMLGPIKYDTQGKTTRSKSDAVDATLKKIDMPRSIMKFYKDVELVGDVIHVNYVPFLTTMSSNMHYGTITTFNNLKRAS